MRLLAAVHATLDRAEIAHAVIGAAALAVHGVVRSTVDLDLLAIDLGCLDMALWAELSLRGTQVDIRRGDAEDPLAGVVRLEMAGARDVDVVVGRGGWQSTTVVRAEPAELGGVAIRVVTAADLVLLKLYAAGPQDRWDIQQLLGASDRASLEREVELRLPALPEESRRLWTELRVR